MSARSKMQSTNYDNHDYDAAIAAWQKRAGWRRRVFAFIGLQGKLIFCFMMLMSFALAASCWSFISESRDVLARLVGQKALQISTTLAMASETPMKQGNVKELNRLNQRLIHGGDIIRIVFFDADGRPVAWAQSGDQAESLTRVLPGPNTITKQLMQVSHNQSPTLGRYAQVIAPVVATTAPRIGPNGAETSGKLLGFVLICVAEDKILAQLAKVNTVVTFIGCFVVLMSFPLVYMLVKRIFQPIRELVGAADRIANGDLNAKVEIDRPDIIGMLAWSFNEMVQRVKSQQQALESANRDLESKVHARTTELESANKRLSNEIAEKEDFLRAVSHDLNAPLRNISGMATMLLMKNREKFDDDIIHRLERIQKNVEVETDLITELLELSRIKTRRQKMEPVDVDAMVRDLAGMFDEDLRSKSIELIVDCALPTVNGERARLRQVFQNLIDNAIKYMGEGSSPLGLAMIKQIHVGCERHGSEIEFYVRDTGMGIEPEDLGKVFCVFRRGKNTASQNIAGKGVGLASVKSIVETYGGRIWVESTPGRGSTFRFTILENHQHDDNLASAIEEPAASQEELILN